VGSDSVTEGVVAGACCAAIVTASNAYCGGKWVMLSAGFGVDIPFAMRIVLA